MTLAAGSGAAVLGREDPRADAVFHHCEEITRRRARNFWYGIRLLPRAKRRAMAAIYALSRRIDDAGDDGRRSDDERRAALEAIEASLAGAHRSSPDPVLAAVGFVAEAFPLPISAFHELVAGVRMDLDGTVYRTFEDLEPYCRRVAGTIGRLSVSVFGARDVPRAERLADDLGVAMQLTNILRDVREDLRRGRVYLPAEDLERLGCTRSDLADPPGDRAVDLIRFEAARAREWFRRGLPLLPMLDRRSAACAGTMAGIYTRLLGRIESRPADVLVRRLSLPTWQKAWVAARGVAGFRP
jgi:phytoene synthase